MNVAEAMAQALAAEGVRIAAGITGQSVGHLADALAEQQQVKAFYTRQERVAVDICDGYARVSGRPGVVFTDNGPAAANAMGGLVNSWGDSTPLLFIAGHTDRADVPRRQTKELPFKELFGPVSKWVAIIDHPGQVADIMRRAFMHLRTGRLGPVVIGLPYDVSSMPVEAFRYAPVSDRPPVRSAGDPAAIARAVALLAAAERPYVYVGSGVLWSQATDELIELAALLTLPVATTLNGKSAFPEDHSLALGIGGFAQARYGTLQATSIAEAADVVLTIGCGFKQHATMAPIGKATIHIQVDVDASELSKETLADLAILGDAKLVLRQLLDSARASLAPARLTPNRGRLEQIAALRARWNAISQPLLTSDEAPLNPFRVTGELMQLVDPDTTILLHDAGSVRGTTCQHYIARRPRSFLGFGVQSAMGWSLGAAIGAKTAAPDRLVAAMIGEEAFAETALDIETSIRAGVPILIVVLNNRAFTDRDGGVSARLAAARFHGGVEICALARALGAKAYRVEHPDHLRDALTQAIDDVRAGTTTVVETMTRRVKTNLARG
jgi:thiamine pyrophosphate-dependent acetolactate synthase large subunit-like protein